MKGKISQIKNNKGETAFPLTSSKAVYMGDGATTVEKKFEEVSSSLETNTNELNNNKKYRINAHDLGIVANDTSFDCSDILQSAINNLCSKGGGVIEFPSGVYNFKGTIILRENVEIVGSSETILWNGNGDLGYEKGTVFKHSPENPTDFLVSSTDFLFGYIGALSFRNIYVVGSSNSLCGIKLNNLVSSNFENLLIRGFDIDLHISGTMRTIFKNISCQKSTNTCLKIDGLLSTTTSFYDCYFGQSFSKPIDIAQTSCLGVNFIDCIFESCKEGIFIGCDNEISFNNIYIENVPSLLHGGVSTDSAINIGIESKDYHRTIINFYGGQIMSLTEGIANGSSLVNVSYCDILNFIGVSFARANKIIKSTSNTKQVNFNGCTETQITSGLYDGDVKKYNIIGCYSKAYNTFVSNRINNLSINDYKVISEHSLTPNDLKFSLPNKTPTLILDDNKNVQFFGQNSNHHLITGGGAIIVNPTSPTISGTLNSSLLYSKEVDGELMLHHISNRYRNRPILVNNFGGTSERQTTGRYIGMMYFDTVIGKPIWWNGSNWVDSNGVVV